MSPKVQNRVISGPTKNNVCPPKFKTKIDACKVAVGRPVPEEIFHIISFEPISDRSTSESFHESRMQLVRIDVIGTFWRATTREL